MLLELDYGFFSHFTKSNGRDLIHEDLTGKDYLLVTIGDSWTWGYSLYNIGANTVSDDPRRLTSVYGYHLKNFLNNCDWINIACPGTANLWITDSASRFAQISNFVNYKKIIMSVGLTDVGRDIINRSIIPAESILNEAIHHEKNCLTGLQDLANMKNILLLVGRNFTSTHESNANILKHQLPKRWVDISAENWPGGWFPPQCMIMSWPSTMSLSDKKWADSTGFYLAAETTRFLIECPLHYKIAGKHPTEISHRLWAEYVFSYIQDNNLL